MLRRLLPSLLAAGLILTACGNNDRNETPVTTSSTTTTAASPDLAQAQRFVLAATDLPSGWAPTQSDQNTANASIDIYQQLSECIGAATANEKQTASATGDTFQSGQSLLSSRAAVYDSEAIVAQQLAGLRNNDKHFCIARTIDDLLVRALAGNAGASHNTHVDNVKDVTLSATQYGFRSTVTLSTTALQQVFYVDFLGQTAGKTNVTAVIFTTNDPAPPSLDRQILDALAAKR